jgi:hypothetical protein
MLDTITWPDITALLQAVFTFLTAGVAFLSIQSNRNMKSVDVSLGCQTRHADAMEKLYRLPYTSLADPSSHPGVDIKNLVSESELFALFNIYWHLIHDEYQYWRDGLISNEMFFRWVDGLFDEFRTDYAYYCRGLNDTEKLITFRQLWFRVRDHWFRNRSFAKFVTEIEHQVDGHAHALNAGDLMHFKPRRFRRVKERRRPRLRMW